MTNIEAIDHIIDVYSKSTSEEDFTGCENIFICNFIDNLFKKSKLTESQHSILINTIHKNKKLANTGNNLYFGGNAFWCTIGAIIQGRFKELMQLKIDFLNKIKPLV